MKKKTITRLALCAVMCLSTMSGRAQNLTINSGAFQGCTSLKVVDIPSGAVLGPNVFEDCTSLTTFWAKSLSVSSDVTCLGKCFYNCRNLQYLGCASHYRDYDGPNRILLGDALVIGSINTIIEEDIVTSIGDYAFAGREIKKINIPASITKIGEYAFENCTALEAVQVNWDMPLSVPTTTFSGVDCSNVILYCPEDVEDFYSMSSVWKDFYVKSGEIPTGITAPTAEESSTVIYDLSGRRLKNLQKGINIVNNKKIIVK